MEPGTVTMTDLSQFEATYKLLAEDPERWMSSARNLSAAADELWALVRRDLESGGPVSDGGGHHGDIAQGPTQPFLQHAPVFLMIAGFAVENALKAVLLKCGRSAATQTKRGQLRIAAELQTHDLHRLARDAGITLTKAEQDLLDRLRDYLVWAGRYPVAASSREQLAVQCIWGTDQQAVSDVIRKLESAFLAGLGGQP
jgi:hypothetical protein